MKRGSTISPCVTCGKPYTILLTAGGAALICGASVMTYLKAQTPMSVQEELTLANLEAMAALPEKIDLELPEDMMLTSRVAGCGSKSMHDWIPWCCPGIGMCTPTTTCTKTIYCD